MATDRSADGPKGKDPNRLQIYVLDDPSHHGSQRKVFYGIAVFQHNGLDSAGSLASAGLMFNMTRKSESSHLPT